MKLKRAKTYRKAMSYLQLNFGFREPYQVLVDEELVLEAAKIKFDIEAGVRRTLQGEVKLMITQCAMEHLYRKKDETAIAIAKKFERRRCGHLPKEDKTLSAFECMSEVILGENGRTNKHRYVVATQKPKLRALLRKVPAIPLIYINRSIMLMEPLSPATTKARNAIESAKLTEGLNKVQPTSSEVEEDQAKRKRKRTKEPNPLSIKKKKSESGAQTSQAAPAGESKPRRKRAKRSNGRSKETATTGDLALAQSPTKNTTEQSSAVQVTDSEPRVALDS